MEPAFGRVPPLNSKGQKTMKKRDTITITRKTKRGTTTRTVQVEINHSLSEGVIQRLILKFGLNVKRA